MSSARVVAVDLGGSSGRVYQAELSPDSLDLTELGRVPNGPVPVAGRLYWDILGLWNGVLETLRDAARAGPVHSLGVDSWAVDYGLLRSDGTMLANPAHHRDPRSNEARDRIVASLGVPALYARTGIAVQPFNTIYQLAADAAAGHLAAATGALLIPDLFSFWLTGTMRTEVTNASTTQLLGLDGKWDPVLLSVAGVRPSLWAPLAEPGEPLGPVAERVHRDVGLARSTVVTTVASHDTASAVVAVPAATEDFAFLSCGSWSLLGVELAAPVVTEQARLAGFTNERGIDSTTRFLRNVMGLWLLQDCLRTWGRQGLRIDLDELLADAAALPACRWVFDVDRPELLPPGDMPGRIRLACSDAGSPPPAGPAEVTRAIVDSLALAYRDTLNQARDLSGHPVSVLHLVGGGVNNTLLCQLTADACGVPVLAGPVESAALGNALVQGRSLGVLPADRWELRGLVARHLPVRRYEPDPSSGAAFQAAGRAPSH